MPAGFVICMTYECRQLLLRGLPVPFHTSCLPNALLYVVGLLVLIIAKLR